HEVRGIRFLQTRAPSPRVDQGSVERDEAIPRLRLKWLAESLEQAAGGPGHPRSWWGDDATSTGRRESDRDSLHRHATRALPPSQPSEPRLKPRSCRLGRRLIVFLFRLLF